MVKLKIDGHVWEVQLEEMDTLKDMAAVSGYTMELMASKIERIIDESISKEDARAEAECKGEGEQKE